MSNSPRIGMDNFYEKFAQVEHTRPTDQAHNLGKCTGEGEKFQVHPLA
ncbi:hypothetical protein [Limnospira fusiformis]